MAEDLLSPSWYRVASSRPRIRAHVRFHRHRYRGRPWLVLEDPASGRCHRLDAAAGELVGLMDGSRTAQELWELACERLGDEAATQDETIRLLGQLHAADLLICDLSPDTEELLLRRQRRIEREGWQRLARPLSQKLPLWDPDAFLVRALPWVRPLFTPAAAVAGTALVALALVVGAFHAEALAAGATRDLLEPHRLARLALAWLAIKSLHELAHAFAVRVWGGAVHEVGVLFLVFFPVPYVDASAASAFPDKRRRMAVGAAGIAVECVLAALALLAWVQLEPGALRSFCYDVLWIGGVSTLLFNGNPLLRFDGYYVLADALEIPNLDARGRRLLAGLAQRHLLGLPEAQVPATAPGEAVWLLGYAVTAFGYRLAVGLGIALFLATHFLLPGLALALFTVTSLLLLPLAKLLAFVVASPRAAERRGRAVAVSCGLAAAAVVGLGVVPVPSRTVATGVVWPPEGAEVRAGADGFVEALLAQPDQVVAPGDPLLQIGDPLLDAELATLAARRREVEARYAAARAADPTRAQIERLELASAEADLARARERAGAAQVHSGAHGAFVPLAGEGLLGRYVRRGELLGHVVGAGASRVRVALPHARVAQVRERTRAVAVRLSRAREQVLPAAIAGIVPGAAERLPSPALGTIAGGPHPVDPADPEGVRTLEPIFVVDVELAPGASPPELGGRATVRFDHAAEPIAVQGWRMLRRVLLRSIGV